MMTIEDRGTVVPRAKCFWATSTMALQVLPQCYSLLGPVMYSNVQGEAATQKKKTLLESENRQTGNQQIPGYKFCCTKKIPSATRQKSCRQRIFSCPVTWIKTSLLIPSYHSTEPRLFYASCSNLMFSDVCPLKKHWKLVAASRASGHRFPPNVSLKGFVFSKQSHGCQSHISEIMFLVVCSKRRIKSNKIRRCSQEKQQQCRWGLEQHHPTTYSYITIKKTYCYLFEFYSPHSMILHTRAQAPRLKLKDGDPGLSSFRPLAPAFDIFTWQEPRRSNFWWACTTLQRGV